MRGNTSSSRTNRTRAETRNETHTVTAKAMTSPSEIRSPPPGELGAEDATCRVPDRRVEPEVIERPHHPRDHREHVEDGVRAPLEERAVVRHHVEQAEGPDAEREGDDAVGQLAASFEQQREIAAREGAGG